MLEIKPAFERSWIVLLLAILTLTTSTGAVSPPPASIATGADLDTFYDHFDDNAFNASLWSTGSFPGTDPQVTVNETGGQLVITPRAGQTNLHYNGLISSRSYNFTQGIIFVEVVESTRGQANTMLMFGADNSNKIAMETESNNLLMSLVVGGTRTGALSIPYDSAAHRWWRIRHVASDDTIRFDTSPNGIAWTQRHSISRVSLSITSGKVNLSAGTWSAVSTPGQARFDNLSWHPLVPNKGDWSAPVNAITPNPTPGTWDHILWGAASPSTVVKFNGMYFLYYIGSEGDTGNPEYNPIRRSLGVATSPDGMQFTKYGSNPIITYTTTGGSVAEEGVGGATAILVGNTIHLYYAAIRSTGGEMVDLDIRYRRSTDGINFTNDTLVYRSPGDEYAPLGVTYSGGIWSVYIKGPLNRGVGAISRLSGSSPTSLPTKTAVTSTTFGSGGNANPVGSNMYIMHFDRRESNEDRFQVRSVNPGTPNVLSEPLFSYTHGNFGDHATPATFKDDATGKWFMYTLNLSQNPVVISVRTYSPSQIPAPTSTPMATMTATPARTSTPTHTPPGTPTRTPTTVAGNTPTNTPTRVPAAFPVAPQLDGFNRANGGIGASWSGFPGAFSILSNQLDVVNGGWDTYILWNSASFGTNQEAYVTFTQLDAASGNEHSLILKSQSNNSSSSGLLYVMYNHTARIVQIWTYHPSQDWVQRGDNIPVTFAAGDQLGARAKAEGTVEVYKNGTLLGTRSVTAWPFHSSGGYIGLWFVNANAARVDNFGGGSIP